MFLPVTTLAITQESFAHYLRSAVFVNHHLSQVAVRWADKFGEDWIAVLLPNELLGLSADYRLGVATYFVDFLDRIRVPGLLPTLLSACEWALADSVIALALLRRAPVVMKSRFSDLPAKVLALIPILAASPLESTKLGLIAAFAEVQVLLNGNENVLYRAFCALGSDRSVAVRIAFLKRIQELYESVPTSNLRNGIVQMFQNLFSDKETAVLECLVNPFMLVRFAEMRSPPTMTIVLNLAERFKTRWRFFSKLMSTIECFPQDCLTSILSRFLGMVEEAVSLNPQSLGRSAVSFYRFLIHARLECMKLPDFLHYLASSYGQSRNFRQRVVYLQLASALLTELARDEFMETVWPQILAYAEEQVSVVRAKVLEFVVAFGKHFQSAHSFALSGQIDDLVRAYDGDSDPQVLEQLRQARHLVGQRKSVSLAGLGEARQGLPTIERGFGSPRSPRMAKPPAPRESRTISQRRAVGSRLPSPGSPLRPPMTDTVGKSRSTAAVCGLAVGWRSKQSHT
jgi:hypothetical protein